jgi:hypothetical protein
MRPAHGAGLGILLLGVCATPAAAVPLDDALQVVSAACAATRSTLTDAGGAVSNATSTVSFAPGRFLLESPGRNRVVVDGTGTYGAVADDGLRAKDRRKALSYLKRPDATWWLNPGKYQSGPQGWSATFGQSRDEAVPVAGDCAQGLADSGPEVQRIGDVWTFLSAGNGPVQVSTDSSGRLVQWDQTSYTYAAQSVVQPASPLTYRAWQKASEAAGLNATMRELTRQVARDVNAAGPGVAAIDAGVRAAVPADRVVPLKVRALRKGVLIHARNPYSGTYHAWRVYLKAGQAIARKVAP